MTDAERAATAVIALLQRISRQLEQLPDRIAEVSNRQATRALPQADRRALALLLPAIHESIGSAVFTAADLIGHANRTPSLEHALKNFEDGIGARKIGKLFARSVGFSVPDGYRITRSVKIREGILWRVDATMETRINTQTRDRP